jgi:hypothetical protein
MKDKIRELTDRNRGISNKVREAKYQQYVQGDKLLQTNSQAGLYIPA